MNTDEIYNALLPKAKSLGYSEGELKTAITESKGDFNKIISMLSKSEKKIDPGPNNYKNEEKELKKNIDGFTGVRLMGELSDPKDLSKFNSETPPVVREPEIQKTRFGELYRNGTIFRDGDDVLTDNRLKQKELNETLENIKKNTPYMANEQFNYPSSEEPHNLSEMVYVSHMNYKKALNKFNRGGDYYSPFRANVNN